MVTYDVWYRNPMGAKVAEEIFKQKSALKTAQKLLSGITGLDDKSIVNACKIFSFAA